VRAEETVRRKLHNTILELKGNIRVFCRVRPPVGEEKTDPNVLSHITFNDGDDKEISLVQASESASGSKTVTKAFPFAFDKVFKPSSTQGEVFDEISQLVQSALDGYKVCIFAYGQTGSGKTYTMEGKLLSTTTTTFNVTNFPFFPSSSSSSSFVDLHQVLPSALIPMKSWA